MLVMLLSEYYTVIILGIVLQRKTKGLGVLSNHVFFKPSCPAVLDSSLRPRGLISFDSLITTLSYCEIWDRWPEREHVTPEAAFRRRGRIITKRHRHTKQELNKSRVQRGDGDSPGTERPVLITHRVCE